jgi:hypothetical protein
MAIAFTWRIDVGVDIVTDKPRPVVVDA